jgi:hypothetical protein
LSTWSSRKKYSNAFIGKAAMYAALILDRVAYIRGSIRIVAYFESMKDQGGSFSYADYKP